MRFVRDHLGDPGWFQLGSYALFDRQAQDILDGKSSPFWIDDPSRTDLAQYPPGFSLWVAFIYHVSSVRSPLVVQQVTWLFDAILTPLLIIGIGVTAYGWREALMAGALAALSPLLAMYGAWPSSDAPTSWLVLAGVWMFLLAAKKKSVPWAIGAGSMLGAACWLRVNPLFLVVSWALALLVLLRTTWQVRLRLSLAVLLCTMLIVFPITLRNAIVFHEFVPNGLNLGVNLEEGLGETRRGLESGMMVSDQLILESEREELNLPPDYPLKLAYPDGIRRDRKRARDALQIIVRHPFWYAGVMARRAAGLLKFAGEPAPYQGSPGINVTSKKCLPPSRQGGILAGLVNILGMMQSVKRYVILPLMLAGIWLGLGKDKLMTILLLTTVLYYLVTGSSAHTEIRYVLPMQALLFVFAGLSAYRGLELLGELRKKVVGRTSQD